MYAQQRDARKLRHNNPPADRRTCPSDCCCRLRGMGEPWSCGSLLATPFYPAFTAGPFIARRRRPLGARPTPGGCTRRQGTAALGAQRNGRDTASAGCHRCVPWCVGRVGPLRVSAILPPGAVRSVEQWSTSGSSRKVFLVCMRQEADRDGSHDLPQCRRLGDLLWQTSDAAMGLAAFWRAPL